mmetsp:Transcript_127163/g.365731  ORF Transcript_127163/g.365731 Transcript_127163/m.365731 type:complete len:239 (+) Transcript_127163:69-785(+)
MGIRNWARRAEPTIPAPRRKAKHNGWAARAKMHCPPECACPNGIAVTQGVLRDTRLAPGSAGERVGLCTLAKFRRSVAMRPQSGPPADSGVCRRGCVLEPLQDNRSGMLYNIELGHWSNLNLTPLGQRSRFRGCLQDRLQLLHTLLELREERVGRFPHSREGAFNDLPYNRLDPRVCLLIGASLSSGDVVIDEAADAGHGGEGDGGCLLHQGKGDLHDRWPQNRLPMFKRDIDFGHRI